MIFTRNWDPQAPEAKQPYPHQILGPYWHTARPSLAVLHVFNLAAAGEWAALRDLPRCQPAGRRASVAGRPDPAVGHAKI